MACVYLFANRAFIGVGSVQVHVAMAVRGYLVTPRITQRSRTKNDNLSN